jgi:hypothetical protein
MGMRGSYILGAVIVALLAIISIDVLTSGSYSLPFAWKLCAFGLILIIMLALLLFRYEEIKLAREKEMADTRGLPDNSEE